MGPNIETFSTPQWQQKNSSHTVDGRSPAPVEVGSLSHYSQGLVHLRWLLEISAINSTITNPPCGGCTTRGRMTCGVTGTATAGRAGNGNSRLRRLPAQPARLEPMEISTLPKCLGIYQMGNESWHESWCLIISRYHSFVVWGMHLFNPKRKKSKKLYLQYRKPDKLFCSWTKICFW